MSIPVPKRIAASCLVVLCALALIRPGGARSAPPTAADATRSLVGAWVIVVDPHVGAATYHFRADGTFTLEFEGRHGGAAGGRWRLAGDVLTMDNTWSEVSFTTPGEQETARVVGVTDTELRLRTTDGRGAEEVLVLAKLAPPPAFEKGKRQTAGVVGAYRAADTGRLLVLADDGTAVFSLGRVPIIGKWREADGVLHVQTAEVPEDAMRQLLEYDQEFDVDPAATRPSTTRAAQAMATTRPDDRRAAVRYFPLAAVTEPTRRGATSTQPAGRGPATRGATSRAYGEPPSRRRQVVEFEWPVLSVSESVIVLDMGYGGTPRRVRLQRVVQ